MVSAHFSFFVTRLTYPGFYFAFTWFISDLISFNHLLGSSFHLISLCKFCLYSSHCLCFQMSLWFYFRDFGDQGRIGESNCGYGVNFAVLNWYGWKLCWGVLHCNTRKDKLNVLLFSTPVSMSWCDHVNHNCNQNISFSFQNNGSLINALNDAEHLWMGLWTRCPQAVDCWVKPLELEERKSYSHHRNDKEE